MKYTSLAIIATIAATLCFATAASASDVVRDDASPSRDLAAASTSHLTSAIVPTPGTLALLALAGCIGLTRRPKD